MFVLDHKTLAQHRAGRVLALDARAIGSSVALRTERPSAKTSAAAAKPRTPTVAVVDIIGPLAQRGESQLCGYVDGYDWIGERLGAALEEADAVVLRIDSPGGDVAGLDEGVRRMRALVDASGKRVVAYVDELCASAAYQIACGVADEIVVPPAGCVGSIGTWGLFVDATKASENEGLAITVVRDPEGKAASHPLGPVTDLALARLQEEVSTGTREFIAFVAARRNLSETVLRKLNGDVLRGTDAVKAGLADRVGTLEDTIRGAAAPREQRAQMNQKSNTKAEDAKPEQPAPEPAAADPVPIQDGMVTCPECGATFPVAMPEQGPPSEEAQALAALVKATGAASPLAALAHVAAEFAVLSEFRRREDRQARAALGAQLVRAGVPPSEVWADPAKATDLESREVNALYAAMPIEKLREMAERKSGLPAAFRAPASTDSAQLSATEASFLKSRKRDPEKYLATKAAIVARRTA